MTANRNKDGIFAEDERWCEERLGLRNVRGQLARRIRECSPGLTLEEHLKMPLGRGRFLVVDLETSGMRASESGIIEIGAVEVDGYRLGRELSSLCRPEVPVPLFIQRLTGITGRMLEDAPLLGEVLPSLDSMLRSRILVAHNLRFDRAFLRQAYRDKLGKPLDAPGLCTVKLSRRVFPALESHNLDSLARYLRIRPEPNGPRARHRALGDARLTARALIKILRRLESEGMADVGELLLLESSRRKPKKKLTGA